MHAVCFACITVGLLHCMIVVVNTLACIKPTTVLCPQTVALWDLRNLKLKLHSFESHKDEIFQVGDSFAFSGLPASMFALPSWVFKT